MDRPILGGEAERITQLIQAFEEDCLWIQENYQNLLSLYEDQWIAVLDKQVIASDRDFKKLISKVPENPRTRFEFITRKPFEAII